MKMEYNFEKVMAERSDSELIDIVTIQSANYKPLAIETAEKELKKRNIDTSKFQGIREKLKIVNETNLELGKKISRFWVYFGYAALLFTGGIYGIIAGYIYRYSKLKTENGNEFFIYNKSSREEGKVMIILGCVVLGIHLITKVNWNQL